jgi:hypothetical protein
LTDNSNKYIDNVIYLVPELVLITGIENDKSGRSRRQDIITKTKTNPSQRMNEINIIHDLMILGKNLYFFYLLEKKEKKINE